jgi:hypothetical protein
MNEQWRETPEWIAVVIAVRPMMRLEHCHIATLVQIIMRTNEALRGVIAYTRITMRSIASSSSRRGKSWVLIRNLLGGIKPSAGD